MKITVKKQLRISDLFSILEEKTRKDIAYGKELKEEPAQHPAHHDRPDARRLSGNRRPSRCKDAISGPPCIPGDALQQCLHRLPKLHPGPLRPAHRPFPGTSRPGRLYGQSPLGVSRHHGRGAVKGRLLHPMRGEDACPSPAEPHGLPQHRAPRRLPPRLSERQRAIRGKPEDRR